MNTQNQYLTLRVGDAVYGIGIHKVREVVAYETPSPMPNSSNCMIGVINLRGSAVPVLDLRLKFGLTSTIPTVDTCIIILELEAKGKLVLIGITADMVQQVADFEEADMVAPPQLSDGTSVDLILAMARFENGFVILLDIDKTLESDARIAINNETLMQNSIQCSGETV